MLTSTKGITDIKLIVIVRKKKFFFNFLILKLSDGHVEAVALQVLPPPLDPLTHRTVKRADLLFFPHFSTVTLGL